MTTTVSFLFVLGVLVFIHELGHFLAARRVGIRVLTFSLGFGPKLLKVQRGDTEYCISALPLGGYVKMAGEAGDETTSGAPDEFLSKTKWQRFQVLIMGPVMNIALAVVIFAIVGMFATEVALYLSARPVIGVVTEGSAAERAGLKVGDELLRVGDARVPTWEDFYEAVAMKSGQTASVTYTRDGQQQSANVEVETPPSFYAPDIGVEPDVYPVVRQTQPGDPAEKAGVRAGDIIHAIDGERMRSPSQIAQVISKKAGIPVDLDIERDGVERHIRVTPIERGGGKIGIVPGVPTKIVHLKPGAAIAQSFSDCGESIVAILQTIGGLLTGHNSVKQLSGPYKIAQMSGEAARRGAADLFKFMAALSLNLGLLNLLPIPILDGGHIMLMGIESIARRDLSAQVKERMLMAGFVLLMMLMVTVFYNDFGGLSGIQQLMRGRN